MLADADIAAAHHGVNHFDAGHGKPSQSARDHSILLAEDAGLLTMKGIS